MVEYITIRIPRLFPPLISSLIALSLLFAVPVLVLSLLNRDREVEGLGVAAIILTVSFHLVVGVWSWIYMRRQEEGIFEQMTPGGRSIDIVPSQSHFGAIDESEYPRYYTSPGTISAYALSVFWFLCFAINTQDVLNGPELYLTAEVNAKWKFGVEVAESVFMGIEGLLAGLLAGYCTVVRRGIGKRRREHPMVEARGSGSGLMRSTMNESTDSIAPMPRPRNIHPRYEDDEVRERSRFSSDSSLLRVPPPATLKKKASLFTVSSPLRVVVNTLPATD